MTDARSKLLAGAALGAAVLLTSSFTVGCGGSGKPPTLPTPIATPTPTPTPDPNVPPEGSACKDPIPPPIARINAKISYKFKDYWVLDSSPLVHDALFCLQIGYTDGRLYCTLRVEGDPSRPACENWRAGIAEDTHTWGPTWKFTPPGGTWTYCTGPDSGCDHMPDSPFQLKAYKGGHYQICTAYGVCTELDVDRNL